MVILWDFPFSALFELVMTPVSDKQQIAKKHGQLYQNVEENLAILGQFHFAACKLSHQDVI